MQFLFFFWDFFVVLNSVHSMWILLIYIVFASTLISEKRKTTSAKTGAAGAAVLEIKQ